MKAFLAIAVNGIDSYWKMMVDLLFGIPAIFCRLILSSAYHFNFVLIGPFYAGQHTGHSFGNVFVGKLDEIKLSDILVSITANDTSSNSTFSARVENRMGVGFEVNNQILGCMAHVIKLAAHNSIKVFFNAPDLENENDSNQEVTLSRMDINNIVDEPDG